MRHRIHLVNSTEEHGLQKAMVTHISTVPTPPGGLLVYIIPVNLDLPETLKKDLHLDCYRREQSKGIKHFGDIRDDVSLGHLVDTRRVRDVETELVRGNVPLYAQGLGVLIFSEDMYFT